MLRRAARTICLAAAGAVLAGMALEALSLMLASDAFVFVLKIVCTAAVALAAVHFFLWATGKDNRSRIEELKAQRKEET